MFVFKCKMCGGTVNFEPGDTVGVCDSCGTRQTLPRLDDSKKANRYDRANHFRRNNEYDKAMGIYEQILDEDDTDAEAYWSIVLCRYGIEYIEDPASHKQVPTVNRAQFTSIYMDEDYKSAIRYADVSSRAVYEEEAAQIDEIQRRILEISSKEEPFDVFICYKETDHNGRRTPDSVLANDLYYLLTQEGFKVFFSRITLEDKLGSAYEPYIFSALNTAAVMVVLGTKPEHFNAVWVKNEWSRYLALMKNGAEKTLIPAYRDMDPYDLPEEFSHLQALDMAKLGFMQDLVRGIRKIIGPSAKKPAAAEKSAAANDNTSVAPLLKRAFLFLEDGSFAEADAYCEKVLDADPENALGYLGKLMAELRIRTREELSEAAEPFDDSGNYQKAVRFGSKELADELRSCVAQIKARKEYERLAETYNRGIRSMNNAGTVKALAAAASLFKSISGYRDADEQESRCESMIESMRLEAAHRAEENRIAAEKAAKRRKKALVIFASAVCACAALAVFVTTVFVPWVRYRRALTAINDGRIVDGYESLLALDGFGKSAEKAEEVCGQYIGVTAAAAKVGDTIRFGTYEQDGKTSNGSERIEWRVLKKENDRILLISEKALDCRRYHSDTKSITWEDSSLRSWLNDDFLHTAFSTAEQTMILNTDVSADSNPDYGTSAKETTTDRVFLLSTKEAEDYFWSDADRQCAPTTYARKNGAWYDLPSVGSGTSACTWWLRTPGKTLHRCAFITSSGYISYYGTTVSDTTYCVRPALWIGYET